MYVHIFLCGAVLYVGRRLEMGRFPVQGVLTKSEVNSDSEQTRGPNP